MTFGRSRYGGVRRGPTADGTGPALARVRVQEGAGAVRRRIRLAPRTVCHASMTGHSLPRALAGAVAVAVDAITLSS
ncbi:hypothetical protein GCM10010358_52870 [Streptomyces minutiscleroticus]|uniref:Uncharacterized protein n=1 Tax=Streptomyces minutiscleroticus TaxID=68238 RepID=A0A918U4S4_9ACTN|nr:hypothetical protein GCM10010358_52870 [Streptomyces minutiscleroticus]